jgi:hypothetical protein
MSWQRNLGLDGIPPTFKQPKSGIWVTTYESLYAPFSPPWLVKSGLHFDGEHGFGDSNTDYFSGEALLLSRNSKMVQTLSVGRIHVQGLSWTWLIEDIECLPEAPFLISPDLSIQIIFDGYIGLSDEQDLICPDDPDDYGYAVVTANWVGVITVEAYGKFRLIAFSSHGKDCITDNEELWSFEYDCPAGHLKLL